MCENYEKPKSKEKKDSKFQSRTNFVMIKNFKEAGYLPFKMYKKLNQRETIFDMRSLLENKKAKELFKISKIKFITFQLK